MLSLSGSPSPRTGEKSGEPAVSLETRVKLKKGKIWKLCGIWTLSSVKRGVFSDLGTESDMIKTAIEAQGTD